MRRLLTAAVVAGLLAACSSSSAPRAHQQSTTTRGRRSVPVATSVHSPQAAAIALTRRLVRKAVLPPGARRTAASLPPLLRGPWEVEAGGNLVTTKRAWLVPGPPDSVMAFVTGHVPRGLDGRGTGHGTESSPAEQVEYAVDTLHNLPPDIFAAGLEIGAEARGASSLVNVIAGAQWTPRRPVDERVPQRDRIVIVTAFRPYAPRKPVVRRVVVPGSDAAAIIKAFNQLRVAPRTVVHCVLLDDRTLAYRLEFARSTGAPSDVVAGLGRCGPITVTVGGQRRLALAASAAFEAAVAHALGVPELHFFR